MNFEEKSQAHAKEHAFLTELAELCNKHKIKIEACGAYGYDA